MAMVIIERTIDAPLKRVWAAASDFTKSPGPSISVVVEKEGDPKAFGCGTVRAITIGKSRARERLESVEPSSHFTYRMLSGAPVRDYLGRVEFKPYGKTTVVRWTVEFKPVIPGTAWLVSRVIRGVLNRFIDELG